MLVLGEILSLCEPCRFRAVTVQQREGRERCEKGMCPPTGLALNKSCCIRRNWTLRLAMITVCAAGLLLAAVPATAGVSALNDADLSSVTGGCGSGNCCDAHGGSTCSYPADREPDPQDVPPDNRCDYGDLGAGMSNCGRANEDCGWVHTYGPSNHDTCPQTTDSRVCGLDTNGWCVRGTFYWCQNHIENCECDWYLNNKEYGDRNYCGTAWGDDPC
jgi:hypothetical protein